MIRLPRHRYRFTRYLLLLVWLLAGGSLSAQYTHELGTFFGVANYQGDLPEPHVELIESRLAGGVYYRYHFGPRWNLRGNLFLGRITGDDVHAKSRSSRQFRFTSPIGEAAVMMEWKIFGRRSNYYVGLFQPFMTPYLFAGIAFAWANPKPECYRSDCPPGSDPFSVEMNQNVFLGTPFGLGVRYDITPKVTLGMEVGQRPVFSDLLDGVSVTANPDRNDWYIFTGMTVSYMIGQARYRDVNYQ